MTEKTKKPYDWKHESLDKDEVLTNAKKKARLATAALVLSLGLNIELLSDHAPSKAILAMLNQDKTEEMSTNPNLIDSKVITIDENETLSEEATQAFKDMAAKNHIDLSQIPFEQIQNESREAQAGHNVEAVSYPNDQYITELSKNIAGGYEASVQPVQK